jgi:hypothetical protein
MKEVLFKHEVKLYYNTEYQNYLDLDDDLPISPDGPISFSAKYHETFIKKTKKIYEGPYYFVRKNVDKEESTFEKNYGNPLFNIVRNNFLIVVEKENDKVCLKYFLTTTTRKVGKVYFQKKTRVEYITLNLRTGDLYKGSIINYHLKTKCSKKLRKNCFNYSPISAFISEIKNYLGSFEQKPNNYEIIRDALASFMLNVPYSNTYHKEDDRVYQYYLEKKQIKYPDNFKAFRTCDYDYRTTLKEVRKSKSKMVDAFMKKNDLHGKVLKKVLHAVENLNLKTYKIALSFFGADWMNQDPELTKSCLNYDESWWFSTNTNLHDVFSPEEIKRVFALFKKVIQEKSIDSRTFYDHITYYLELKAFGEEDLRWNSSTDVELFRQEHLDWAEKISHYKNGIFARIYPKEINDYISHVIQSNGVNYFPVILRNTNDYNAESMIQSNCVRTYIESCNTIIISIRKNGSESEERATIEYRLQKDKTSLKVVARRVQDKIRFNQQPTTEWFEPMEVLDDRVNKYVSSKNYENVKMIKECRNGTIFNYKSFWDENMLVWDSQTKKDSII